MGRKRKEKAEGTNGTTEAPAPAPGGNRFKNAQDFVDRIENLNADKRSIMGRAMNECRQVGEDIKIVYDEAKEAGIPKKALRLVIKTRALEAKAAEIRADLDSEDQNDYDLIRQALGDLADTPLGAAVLEGMAPDVPNVSTADAPFHAPDEPRTASQN